MRVSRAAAEEEPGNPLVKLHDEILDFCDLVTLQEPETRAREDALRTRPPRTKTCGRLDDETGTVRSTVRRLLKAWLFHNSLNTAITRTCTRDPVRAKSAGERYPTREREREVTKKQQLENCVLNFRHAGELEEAADAAPRLEEGLCEKEEEPLCTTEDSSRVQVVLSRA